MGQKGRFLFNKQNEKYLPGFVRKREKYDKKKCQNSKVSKSV